MAMTVEEFQDIHDEYMEFLTFAEGLVDARRSEARAAHNRAVAHLDELELGQELEDLSRAADTYADCLQKVIERHRQYCSILEQAIADKKMMDR